MTAPRNSNVFPRVVENCSTFARRAFSTCVLLFCALAVLVSSALAQTNVSGRFVGVVTDERGAAIPDARATFTNQSTGATRTVRSGPDGQFSITNLPPGDYQIEVTKEGFRPKVEIQSLFTMVPTEVRPKPFVLAPETMAVGPTTSPSPGVVATPEPVRTPASSTAGADDRGAEVQGLSLDPSRGGAFDDRLIQALPLGGTTLTRTFDELAFYVPGVNPPPQAIGNTVGPGVGGGVGTSGQFSVNGLRSRANNFTVDGSDNNDEDIGVRRQGFLTLVPQPIESIQEFSIITLLAPAQFGRNLGAQVNANSKGGGNSFHGIIYGLGNADFLNARNTFDSAGGDTAIPLTGVRTSDNASIPVFVDGVQPLVRNDAGEKDAFSVLQGGFALGGPIRSNSLFFFASGEFQNIDGTRERNFAVPTVEERGFVRSGVTGLTQQVGNNQLIGFATSADGDAVFSLFPFPNNPGGVYGRNTYTQALSTDARGGILSGRIDYNFFRNTSRTQTLTARYNYTDDRRDLTDVGGALYSAIRPEVRTDNFSTYLSGLLGGNLSNEFRFSWGRTRLSFEKLDEGTGFLRPISSTQISSPDERRFLLNAPLLLNVTLPVCGPNGCFAPPFAQYVSAGTTALNSTLGPIGQLNVAGFSPVGVDVFNFPQERENDTFQFADTLRWQIAAAGQHSLAFGADIRRTFLASDLPRNSRPLVTFNGSPDAASVRALCLTGLCGGAVTIILAGQPPPPVQQDACAGVFCTGADLASSGAATGFFQSLVLPGKDASIDLSYHQLNFFAQDEWRVHPKLNLNFGIRYEHNTTPKEADRKIEDTFGAQPYPFLTGLASFIEGRTSIYESDRNNFAPRLGFAYAPTSSTVVRGGYGIYYDQILGAVVSQSRNVLPTFTTANFGGGSLIDNDFDFTLFNPLNAVFGTQFVFNCQDFDICGNAGFTPLIQPGTLNTINPSLSQQQLLVALQDIFGLFPFSAIGSTTSRNGSSFGLTLPTRELDTPFSHQYSIGIEQRLFGSDTYVSAAYVGTTGRSLLRFTSPNLGSNFISVVDEVNLDESGEPIISGITLDPRGQRPTAGFGPVNRFETSGRSQYNSVQLALRGRLLNRSLQYQTSYVYGKVNDDVSDVFDLAGAFALPQNSLTFAGEYAPANFDVRHRFTYNFIYGAPELRGRNAVVQTLFGGWQIAGTGRFNTGQPFTVNSIFDVNLDGNLTDRLESTGFITVTDDRSRPLSLSCTGIQCQQMLAQLGGDGDVPRNSFRAGNILELDMALSKRFNFQETQAVQFRVDVFNFLNRANYAIPVRFLEAPGFGRAVDTVTPGRRFQLVLRYIF